MIEFYIGNTGIKFQNIEDIKYIIDNSLEEELLNFFMSLVDVQMIGLLGLTKQTKRTRKMIILALT